MQRAERMRSWAVSHLAGLVAEAAGIDAARLDTAGSFAEMGIDSFRVLKLIKRLEDDFGELPKTLLFENFNVEDLAGYFVREHEARVAALAGLGAEAAANAAPPLAAAAVQPALPSPAPVPAASAAPLLILESDALAQPELAALVKSLADRYANEAGASRGARSIAPNLFIGSARRGYFQYARCRSTILAYAYTGPQEGFAEVAAEFDAHCRARGLQLNLFTDRVLDALDGTRYTSTPFGALQRIVELPRFTLEGGSMRRLRYLVQKYQKSGSAQTVEYRPGDDAGVEAEIAAVIDRWCAGKTMVNPLVHVVRQEIVSRTLDARHRLFLTRLDGVLHNAILISPLASELDGWLMDLEFYGPEMPLGGLEFAIVQIVEQLVREGRSMLSLGGTYGCRLERCEQADPEVERVLDQLHSQGIFNDDGNLQFKNKFRPENRTVFLCRPAEGSRGDNVVDLIMMIADPAAMQTSDAENHSRPAAPAPAAPAVPAAPEAPLPLPAPAAPTAVPAASAAPGGDRQARLRELQAAGWNPQLLPAAGLDLRTDSWAQLRLPAIEARMSHLRGQLQLAAPLDACLRGVFPFPHFVLAASGRAAEEAFYRCWPRKGAVLQNLLFPSGLFAQIDSGLEPAEIPRPEALDPACAEPLKAELSLDALRERLQAGADGISMLVVELADNAVGGLPVTLEHLRAVRQLLQPHGIALVLDATRVMTNAAQLEGLEPAAGHGLFEIARELLGQADVVTCSLAKDFGIDRGGLVALRDAGLARRVAETVVERGLGLDPIERKLVALAMQDLPRIEIQTRRRLESVRLVHESLAERGLPVAVPAGGHAVLIDVARVPAFASLPQPVPSFLAWLYLRTGIRAGWLGVGMRKGTAANAQVRLAIPQGLRAEQLQDLVTRVAEAFASIRDIPQLALEPGSGSAADPHARFVLEAMQDPEPEAAAPVAAPVAAEAVAPQPAAARGASVPAAEPANAARYRVRDIAVIGMSGRYPQARDLHQFWTNLAAGRDSIVELPPERMAQRGAFGPARRYRGGFIDEVDRFDSLFFNVSPRDAELMDPQERLFLEVAWEALEDAGHTPESLTRADARRDIGVYVGAVWAMYQMVGLEDRLQGGALVPNSFLWSIANHVSYCLNLCGPSLTVDTACSSSLTALHLACEAIYRGECSAALVGGVNLDLHQGKIDINLVGGALSKDGVCRSFGKGANGYVAGEGVGALLIKPLEEALRDGDPIHGVIKGVAVNHGGRSSGYAVPSPRAQAEVIEAALAQAGVDARSIGYIEAHGTGTELGDPVEIKGLSAAFEKHGVPAQACAIGSVKTNIGHLEAAAGIVGVCKVLLQMRHRQLAPSLHAAELNEHIDFEHSPFRVVQALQPWRPREVDGRSEPLRAGVSSFGAGGSNAHVVLEAWTAPPAAELEAAERAFPLSARSEEQLREQARRLLAHLHGPAAQEAASAEGLLAMATTLQHGRRAFEYRAAVVARSAPELAEGLAALAEGARHARLCTGSARSGETLVRVLSRSEQEAFVRMLGASGDARKLAQLWVEGVFADWRGATDAQAVRRVHLPTYPFADRRHWAASASAVHGRSALAGPALHPMLDANESTFNRQLFRKRFHERDFFIHDHCVSGIPTLPGVAYLELARKAGEIAAGRPVRRIRNILWLSPIAVREGQPLDVQVELKPAGEAVHFEVFSEGGPRGRTVHSQGQLLYSPGDPAAPDRIDLDAIRERCRRRVDGPAAYPVFESFGLALGSGFQVLGEVLRDGDETLGRLRLPAHRVADLQQLLLHPSLLDGSLQAGAASQLDARATSMAVPYSIGEVEIVQALQPECWSYVTVVRDGKDGASKVSRANVLIVDDQGQVLVRLRETVGVPLDDVHRGSAEVTPDDGAERLAYEPAWVPAPLPAVAAAVPAAGTALVLVDAGDELLQALREEVLRSCGGAEAVVAWRSDGPGFGPALDALEARGLAPAAVVLCRLPGQGDALPPEREVFATMHLCQALGTRRSIDRVRLLAVFAGEDGQAAPQHRALAGFAASLKHEHPRLPLRTLELQGLPSPAALASAILAEVAGAADESAVLRIESGVRQRRQLQPLELPAPAEAALRERGHVLVTGGAGGLGLLFVEHLARRCRARLVLTGRSALGEAQRRRLDALAELGAEVLYLQADVADRTQLQAALDQARERFGPLHGVIHAAGVLRDGYLRQKSDADMAAVLAPKVSGTLNLDALTSEDPLDFFVLFSSMTAVGGNPGQCDYGYANAFMDAFAAQREAQRAAGRRQGRTLSLNWSLWAEGGMKLDAQTEQLFRKSTGLRPLATAYGLEAFERALATALPQVVVLEGQRERLERSWGLRPEPVAAPDAAPATAAPSAPAAAPAPAAAAVEAMLREAMTRIAMEMLKLQAEDIRSDKILLDLGFDSIGLATFANRVNEVFALEITPILFFDYPSIDEIARHLAAEKGQALAARLPQQGQAAAAQPVPTARATVQQAEAAPAFGKAWTPPEAAAPQAAADGGYFPERRFEHEPIAIVGMSGRMPQCDDLEAFWEGLREGRDLVTLIPPDRWDWREIDGDPLKEPGKTNSRWGAFMKEVDRFDPLFFGISPREAQMMDPQQRLFLQSVWEAVEDAGHKVSDLSGTRTGLFVGVATNDYVNLINRLKIGIDAYTASGNSHSVLANRVSYLLNLRGPSAPIDTACSSSLIALHRAIESIHTGSCEMAIVGGVQVMLTPAAHVSFSMAGMLSGDGRCKTFDKRANGYVRGEGSGAVLIKPLSRALADGDHVYAVVRATAENHGGRVTTLTAPNASAQAELLVKAYTTAGFDPATVGYIECHGTGTSLGDPIEVQALTRAFAELYRRQGRDAAAEPHCGLSSVKTNIGHLETAAGIAGVLKALLAIRHRQIPANLHFEELNPYINLKGTPFYVAQRTTDWAAPRDAEGRELPRRAGVSSFGFGGANAHIVLEEYPQRPVVLPGEADRPRLFVLSAKNADRLQAYAQRLHAHLQRHEEDVDSLSYTLQVGRDAHAERLAIVARDSAGVVEALAAFVAGAAHEGLHAARAARGAEPLAGDALRALLREGGLPALGRAWAAGAEVEWPLLWEAGRPLRASLPTYPFARERHWLPAPSVAAAAEPATGASLPVLHPLVHRNTSTLQEQKFNTQLSGRESFLQDHVVETQRVLPGVAYLEIARAAGRLSAQKDVRFVRQLVWLTPLIVGDDGASVEVSLSPKGADADFLVRSFVDGRWITHCTGRLAFDAMPEAPQHVDLDAIRSRCTQEVLDGESLYAYFAAAGLRLGPSFRIVQRMWASRSESLALLQPVPPADDGPALLLKPALMDGSLHAAIGLMKQGEMDPPLSLPFSVGEVEVLQPVAGVRYGYATWSPASRAEDPSHWKVNFLLLDAEGRVLVRIADFVSKPLHRGAGAARPMPRLPAATAAPEAAASGTLRALVPAWRAVPAPDRASVPAELRVALLGGGPAALAWLQAAFPQAQDLALPDSGDAAALDAALAPALEAEHLLWVAPDEAADASAVVLQLFTLARALMRSGGPTRRLSWTLLTRRSRRVFPSERPETAHAAVAGFFGSLTQECPHWQLRLLDVDGFDGLDARQCLAWAADRQGHGLARRRGQWLRPELATLAALPPAAPAFRERGVYVILGGAGGIGEVLSRHLASRYAARVVWIGRRACDEAIARRLDGVAAVGPRPDYEQADATDEASLRAACERILARHGAIHGVVHSALVLRDRSIAQMDESTLRDALAAKLEASIHLDRAFGGLPLDFQLYFSSVISFNSAAGQANYASGCTFQDAFVQRLQGERPYPVKLVNWGFWGRVGVVADEAYVRTMAQMGIGSIEPDEGVAEIERLLGSPLGQLVVLKTLGGVADARIAALDTVAQLPAGLPALAVSQDPRAGGSPQDWAGERPSAEQDALAGEILAATLQAQGWLDTESTGPQGPKVPHHAARWLAATRRHLQRAGLLDAQGRLTRELGATEALWARWNERRPAWLAEHPNHESQTALLENCLRALPEVLAGRLPATDVLFPRSSMQLVEGVYRGNPLADHYNRLLAEHAARCIEGWLQAEPGRRIRILEVGAGTGGTTAAVLPALARFGEALAEYTYTDLSRAFLLHAERRFRPECAALRTALFDVCRPLQGQAVEAGAYDLVIAANVLHATPDIRATVRNAKAALRRGGVLLLNEISSWSAFSHLTFGLLDGWWLYEDEALRLADCPGLAPEGWHALLAEEGFADVSYPAAGLHALGQQIVAARSDGVVRQAQPAAAPAAPAARAPAPVPVAAAPTAAAAPRPDRPAMTRDHIRQLVAQKLSEALQLEPGRIRHDEPFAEYGVDSIVGVNLVRTISEALQIELETTSLFEFSTVDALAGHIHDTYGAQLAALAAPARPAAAEAAPQAAAAPVAPMATSRFAPAAAATPAPAAPTAEPRPAHDEPIAIIGMSGRFAESETLEDFWRHLRAGDQLVSEVKRWRPEDCVIDPASLPKACRHGSFIDSADRFDAAFFRIAAQEAQYMDPQQRLFLEESWKALEDAGYAQKGRQERRCGVFVGCGSSKYDTLMEGPTPAHTFWGNSESVLPARIAYHLDLQGPAIAINTACSSSLVAMHLACQSLRSGETRMALAGGVFLQPTPGFYKVANRAGMLSPQGRCFSFDARADGFVPGEGVGVVVLKRLSDALRDGDHIEGVIAGSAINQDGSSNGLIAPNGAAQERLEREVYERFGIDPDTIQLLEAHGTGTLIGDAIEFGAVTRAFRQHTARRQFCALGSVKANIGHAATAAGVASVLKVLLAMRHGELPPSPDFGEVNPGVDLGASPFFVNTELRPWDAPEGTPRRAAVSSFGFSGTNVHLVIEQAPRVERPEPARAAHLVVLSARNAAQLRRQAEQLAAFAEARGELRMNDLAHTLMLGRAALPLRLALVARDREELLRQLAQWLQGQPASGVSAGEAEDAARERPSLRRFGQFCIDALKVAEQTGAADEAAEHLAALADLFVQGCALDWAALFPPGSGRISLPGVPLEPQRFWIDQALPETAAAPAPHRNGAAGAPRIALARPASPQERVEQFLRRVAAGELQCDEGEVDVELGYLDLGFTSMGLAELVRRTNLELGVDIAPSLLFEHTSIRALARWLAQAHAAAVEAWAAGPAPRPAEAPRLNGFGHAPEPTLFLDQIVGVHGAELASGYEKITF